MSRVDDPTMDEAEIDRLARQHDLAMGFREAAHRALAFARRYRAEEGAPNGPRERGCIAQAQSWRHAVHDLHAGLAVPALPVGAIEGRPGLASARPGEAKNPDRQTG